MWPQSAFNGPRIVALLSLGNNDMSPQTRMSVTLQYFGLALVGVLVVSTAVVPCTAAQNRELAVSVARRDLRPLGGVTLQLAGALSVQGVTDDNGSVAFLGLPSAGA